MAYSLGKQAVLVVPVDVSTVAFVLNLNRLGFYIECQELNTDWWVTFDAVVAAENVGIKRSGRARFSNDEILPTLAGTNAFTDPISIFVTARAGVTSVNFWIIEFE